MKRTTLWKIVSVCLLIAVSLPLFSALAPTPVDGLDASSLIAPLPYAMEQYGQHHTDIFKDAAPALDGVLEESYTLMDTFDEGAGNFNGLFASYDENGVQLNETNQEFIPDLFELHGTYDDAYIYLYLKTITRNTPDGYSFTPKFGFNFSDSQSDAHDSALLETYAITDEEGAKSGENFYISTEKSDDTVGDSSGSYYVNTTIYEIRVAWASIAEGLVPEKDFERMYLSIVMPFYDDSVPGTSYWIYGVPNEAPLLGDFILATAFGNKIDPETPYTPNVVNLKGDKKIAEEYPAPEITLVERVDENKTKERTFQVTYVTTKLVEGKAESGILYLSDNSVLNGKHLKPDTEGAVNCKGELIGYDSEKEIFTYKATFTVNEDDYKKFFAIRPFVKYTEEIISYGPYYHNTSEYYDEKNKTEYDEYYKLLFIGHSGSAGYMDELILIAKQERVHLTIGRTYSSGQKAHEHWNWLLLGENYISDLNKYPLSSYGIKWGYFTPDDPYINSKNYGTGYTMDQIHMRDDWDIICAVDCPPFAESQQEGIGYIENVNNMMPYLPNLYHYLDYHFPEADKYLQMHWAFQLGYGYSNPVVEDGKVVSGTVTKPASSVDNLEEQNIMYQSLHDSYHTVSEKIGVALFPAGDCWQIARANPIIGDTLCDQFENSKVEGSAIIPDDYYHDGPAGGEFLNACMWFEMITGRDVSKTTWKPTAMTKERAQALRDAAHQAVLEYKATDSWLNNTSVHSK